MTTTYDEKLKAIEDVKALIKDKTIDEQQFAKVYLCLAVKHFEKRGII